MEKLDFSTAPPQQREVSRQMFLGKSLVSCLGGVHGLPPLFWLRPLLWKLQIIRTALLHSRDGKFAIQIGSDWPQMRQIWAAPKCTETDLKKFQICPIWRQSGPFGAQIRHPCPGMSRQVTGDAFSLLNLADKRINDFYFLLHISHSCTVFINKCLDLCSKSMMTSAILSLRLPEIRAIHFCVYSSIWWILSTLQ